jgi:hypothetical protein
MYNYNEAMLSDVLDYIRENYTAEEIAEKLEERDDWAEELNDDMWTADSVTGNGSGSYTFNTWRAEEYLAHNWDILAEALAEFCCDDCNPIKKGAEWCDVTIRCYLLGQAINEALDSLEEERDEYEAIERRAEEESHV